MFLESHNDCTSIEKGLSLCVHIDITPTLLPFQMQNERLLENSEQANAFPLKLTLNRHPNVFYQYYIRYINLLKLPFPSRYFSKDPDT